MGGELGQHRTLKKQPITHEVHVQNWGEVHHDRAWGKKGIIDWGDS